MVLHLEPPVFHFLCGTPVVTFSMAWKLLKCVSSKGLFVVRLVEALEVDGPLRFEACLV